VRRFCSLVVATAVVWTGASAAAGVPQVRFPRDHFGHPGSSIEWWYFTALVHDSAGRRFSVFFTLFASRGLLLPVAQVRDLQTGKLVGQSEQVGPGRVGSARIDGSVSGSRLRYQPTTDTWSFFVSGQRLHVSLQQRPEKPYVLHGNGTGVIRQSVAGRSHYYSDTRMRASGTLRVAGKMVHVAGQSWFDHQWGDYVNDPRAFNWDWFSCRFDNRTELMLYQFLDRRTSLPLAGFRNGTFVDRSGHGVGITAFTAVRGSDVLKVAGHAWPLDWHLRVPALKLTETVQALFPNQLVRTGSLPTFWEGAARATGSNTGTCFVEISHR
jgi:predicted secreted hydrolase